MPTLTAFTVHLSHLQCSVLVSVALNVLERLLTNRMRAFGNAHAAWTLPHVQNLTATYSLNATVIGNASLTHTYNITHLVEKKPQDFSAPGFVSAATLRSLVDIAITAAGAYYWNIFLERRLPARPRGSSSAEAEYKNDKAAAMAMAANEDNEQVEEEIIKKWIATGRVKRASLSITNTVIKWLLDISFGRAVLLLVSQVTRAALRLKWSEALSNMPSNVFLGTLGYAFTPTTMASLLGMVLLPASQRVLFSVVFFTTCSVFFDVLFFVALPRFLASAWGELAINEVLANVWRSGRETRLHELYGSQ